jgi:putative DNA primase/helicase
MSRMDLSPSKGGKIMESTKKPIEVELIKGSTVTPARIVWLWDGWLPSGKLVILAGQPGTGKTTLMLSIAAVTTTGSTLPDGATTDCGSVVIWSGEDGVDDTLVPRLLAMGANMEKVFFVEGKGGRSFDPSRDMLKLAERLESVPDVKLIIVDPVVTAINGDSHKNAEVRKGLQPLVDLGRDTNACIVGISHFNKSGGNNRDPLDLVSGSIAFAAVARVVLGASKLQTPDEQGHTRIFCRIKSNIGPDEDGVGYDLCMTPLPGHSNIEASTVHWGQYVKGHSRDLLAQTQPADQEDRSALRDAQDFLLELLVDGPVASKTVEDEVKASTHAWRTVRRAKVSLGVLDYKAPGKGGNWLWELPEALAQVTCPKTTTQNLGHFGQDGQLTDDNVAKVANLSIISGEETWTSYPDSRIQSEVENAALTYKAPTISDDDFPDPPKPKKENKHDSDRD